MHSCSDVNERLSSAIHNESYEETLSCLMQGAKASVVSFSCGRTAVGSAALIGDVEILALLIQSCEDPDALFKNDISNNIENEVDTTPEGMDCLEWEDEFICNSTNDNKTSSDSNSNDDTIEEFTSLYYYYAKTFERTGDIVLNLENYFMERNSCSKNKALPEDPHTLDHISMSPLHYAAVSGNVESARLLLEHGAKVNATNLEGYTPLHISADNCDMILLLLKYGANPNAQTFGSAETPLHFALKYGKSIAAKLLLKTNKVNLNLTDENDKSALMYAIETDQIDIAKELIHRQAKLNLQDSDGKTALYYAVQKKSIILITRLLEGGARHITSHYLLHQCVQYDMPDILHLLLCHGEHVNSLKVRNPEGFTPIQLAIIHKKPALLDNMLKIDASSLHIEMDNVLLLAVQYAENLAEFKSISRILFGCSEWSALKRSNALIISASSQSCYVPFCQTALSRAIMLHKLHIAEFLIKEGLDLKEICREHVMNHLRTLTSRGSKEFSKLLVLNGFKFPSSSSSKKLKIERQEFEQELKELTQNPLELKSLTRIQLRKHLITKFNSSTVQFKNNYRATKDKSTLQQLIEELELPKVLKLYLLDFYDCESVMAHFV